MIEYLCNVVIGTIGSTCRVHGKKKRCKKKPKYMVFNLDGRARSSRLDSNCCEKHLPEAIKAAWHENSVKGHGRESSDARHPA